MAPPDYEAKWRERWEAEGVGRIADLDAVAAGDVCYNLQQPWPEAGEVEGKQRTVIVQVDSKRRGRLVVCRGTWDVNELPPRATLG